MKHYMLCLREDICYISCIIIDNRCIIILNYLYVCLNQIDDVWQFSQQLLCLYYKELDITFSMLDKVVHWFLFLAIEQAYRTYNDPAFGYMLQ